MIQELIIKIESDKPLSAYGEGHMIIYDSRKGSYYVQTRECFLLPQNEQIKQLQKEIEELKKSNSEFKKNLEEDNKKTISKLENKMEKFSTNIDNKFSEFLHKYQETNSKLIEMVEEVIGGK